MNKLHLFPETDGLQAALMRHSRAIAAPKREPKRMAPLHPMCLAMGRTYWAYEDARQAMREPVKNIKEVSEKIPGGCYCPAGTCQAPVIMGRQTPCLRRPAERPVEQLSKPGSDCATVTTWRRGCDIPAAERVGLWHMRTDKSDKWPGLACEAARMNWMSEYRPAAPGARSGDKYDESLYAQSAEPVGFKAGDRVMTTHDGAATVTGPGYTAGTTMVKLDRCDFEGCTVDYGLTLIDAQPAPAPVKPPLLWRKWSREAAIGGALVYVRDSSVAMYPMSLRACKSLEWQEYLLAAPGTKEGGDLDPSLYTHPDADGWFPHNPVAGAVCPVPSGVAYEVRFRSGKVSERDVGWCWGSTGRGEYEITGWRPAPMTANQGASNRSFTVVTVTEGGANFDYYTSAEEVPISVDAWHTKQMADAVRAQLRDSQIGDEISLDGCAVCFVLTEQKQ